MFGGLLDSAYTRIRCPLWLYDIGESHHVCVHVVKVILAANVGICFPAESSGLTDWTCCCTFLPAHVPPKTREKICVARTFSCVQPLSKLSSAVCLVFLGCSFLDIRTDKCFIKKKKIQKICQSKCQRENLINRTEIIESQIMQNNLREEFQLSDKWD